MLGINGLELVVLVILGILIVGPERLPEYAAQLGQLVKNLRRMADGAREQLRDEIGPDLDDVDWRKLDPRQYDPRRIIREALTDDLGDAVPKPGSSQPTPGPPAPVPHPAGPPPTEHVTPPPPGTPLGSPGGSSREVSGETSASGVGP